MTLTEWQASVRSRLKRWNTPGLWERADFIAGAERDLTTALAVIDTLTEAAQLQHTQWSHGNGDCTPECKAICQALERVNELVSGGGE